MLEPEAAYAHLEDMMALGEGLVSHVVQSVLRNRARELETLRRDVRNWEREAAVSAHHLRRSGGDAAASTEMPPSWGDDFGGDEETMSFQQFDRPVMIHRYPAAIKAFYMQPDPERPELALGFDMLAPGRLWRNHRRRRAHSRVTICSFKRMREQNLPEKAFQWYLDLRRYGSVPHAGFGLGLERTVAWICGTEHIREVIPFPRMIYRVYP